MSIYVSNGDENEIRQFSPEGRVRRIIRRHSEPVPFLEEEFRKSQEWYIDQQLNYPGPQQTDEDLQALERRIRESMESFSFSPHFLPPLLGLLVDDEGYLWVKDRYNWVRPGQWSVFDPEGRWIGVVEVPVRRTSIQWIGKEAVVGVGPGEHTFEIVEGFRLDRRDR